MLQQCCVYTSAPKVTFFSQAPVTAAADQQRTGTILQKKAAAADDSEAWVIRQSIRLSGSLLPVNHAIQWWACASERALAVCARQVPTYIHVYKYFIAHTSLYILCAVHICILYVIILLLRSRCTCRREKKITIDDGQRNKKTADSKIII